MNIKEFRLKLLQFDKNTNLSVYVQSVNVKVNGVVFNGVSAINIDNDKLIFFYGNVDVYIKLEDLFFLSINDEDVLNDMGGIIEEFKGGKNE